MLHVSRLCARHLAPCCSAAGAHGAVSASGGARHFASRRLASVNVRPAALGGVGTLRLAQAHTAPNVRLGVRAMATGAASLPSDAQVLEQLGLSLSDVGAVPAPPPVPDAVASVLDGVAPVYHTLAEAGLGSWWKPTGWFQHFVTFIHDHSALEWGACIMILTMCMRASTIYFNVNMRRFSHKMSHHQEELQRLQAEMHKASQSGDQFRKMIAMADMEHYKKKHDISPFKPLLRQMLPNALIFITNFWAIRGMASAPIAGFDTGGYYWFTNLTVADPTMALPVYNMCALAAAMAFGVDKATTWSQLSWKMIGGVGVLGCVMFYFTLNFPTALVLYWCTSNTITVLLAVVFRSKWVCRQLKIPDKKVFTGRPWSALEYNALKAAAPKGTPTVQQYQLGKAAFDKAATAPMPRIVGGKVAGTIRRS